ncbi:MAG: hypothetical protein ACYS0G_05340 [Planctomycetota bacterium]|jgi:hypothetical protein
METQEIIFDERTESQPIDFCGGATEVYEGCQVDLERDGVRITAKVVSYNPGEPWYGEVTDFPDSDVDEIDGLRIGSPIRFEERHIFGCAA